MGKQSTKNRIIEKISEIEEFITQLYNFIPEDGYIPSSF